MNDNLRNLITGGVGTALSAVGTATQTEHILQIISLVITIIGGIVTFILMPLLAWFKEAKKDGHIDADELNEALKTIKDGSAKVEEEINKKKGQ